MYVNALLKALFSESSSPPSSRLAHVRSLFNTSSSLLVIVPSFTASLQIDPAQLAQDYYLLAHIIQLPDSVRDYRKGIEATTFANGVVHLSETHVIPKRGFPSQTPIKIKQAYPWNPAVRYVSPERLITVIEIEGLLVAPEQPRSLFTRPFVTQQPQFPEKKDLEQIIGRKKGPRAKTSAILGPLLLAFKVSDFQDAESMGCAFRSMVKSANTQIRNILDPDIDIEDAIQEYFEYQTQMPIIDQLKVLHSRKYGGLVLAKMQPALQGLDITQLDLPEANHRHFDLIEETAKELAVLETFHTVQDMIIVIMNCIETLATRGVSADYLIGLLLLTVIKCSYKFSDVTVDLIRYFCKESLNPESGRLGYALLTLESVFIHLRQEYPRYVALAEANGVFWEALENRDLDGILTIGEKEPNALKSGSQGFDALFYAIRQKDIGLLKFLLQKFPEIYTHQYIFEARDRTCSTLLMASIESFNRCATDVILDRIAENFDDNDQRKYFQEVDNAGRSIAHIMQYNDTLIAKIGHLVDWTRRDGNGMTPLLILAGCYDHADYDGMLSLAVSKWHQQRKEKASLRDHIDNKGDSLLHVMNPSSSTIVGKLAKTFGWDVNIPNAKGRTPIMVAVKYDRINFVEQLLKLNASHWQVDGGGMSVFDYAKGKSLKAMYRTIIDQSYLKVDARALKASALNSRSMITIFHSDGRTVHRSDEDFNALCAALEANYPYSWVPQVRLDSDVVFDPWKAFRYNMRNTAYNADYFMSLLQYHETFRNCEEFQEFCYADGSFEPEKHNDQQKHWQKRQNLDGTNKLSYSDMEADQIITFFEYSIEQLKGFRLLYTRMALSFARMQIACHGVRQLSAHLSNVAHSFDYFKMPALPSSYIHSSQVLSLNEDPASSIIMCEARTTSSLIEALGKPIELIKELRQAQSDLQGHRDHLYDLGESKSWPLLYFEEKRTKAIQEEEASIFQTRHRIKELTNSISGSHFSLASELGSYNKFRSAITMDLVKTIAEREIRVGNQVLTALELTKAQYRDMYGVD